MKRSFKTLFRGLLIIVLFTGSAITLSTAGVETMSEAKAAVSYEMVYQYLVNHGYQVFDLNSQRLTENWVAHTEKQGVYYCTTVIVQGGQIQGTSDVPM